MGYSPLMHLSIKRALCKSCFLSSFSNNQYTWKENWAPGRITCNRAFAQAPCYLDFWYGLFNIILPTAEFSFLESYPSWAFIPLIYYHSRRANCFSAPLGTCAGNQGAREGPLFNFLSNKFPPLFFPELFRKYRQIRIHWIPTCSLSSEVQARFSSSGADSWSQRMRWGETVRLWSHCTMTKGLKARE